MRTEPAAVERWTVIAAERQAVVLRTVPDMLEEEEFDAEVVVEPAAAAVAALICA
jgi:hypothetical protein